MRILFADGAEETLADRGAMLARGLGRTRRAGTRALSSLPETPPLPLFGIGGRYATAIYTAIGQRDWTARPENQCCDPCSPT